MREVSVPAARLARWLDGFTARHGATEYVRDGQRVALRGADGARAWLEVPLGSLAWPEEPAGSGGSAESAVHAALLAHVGVPRQVGALLVRRRGAAAGVFDGDRLVASKIATSYVQGATKAGGWSQQRFARRRDNQARRAFGQAADLAAAVLLPPVGTLTALIRGGDRAAVSAVLADPRLAALAALPSPPLLAVPDPRLTILRALPERFTAVRIELDP